MRLAAARDPPRPARLTERATPAPPLSLSLSSFLTKQSAWLKDWRRRYFILKGSKLFFAKVRAARAARRARRSASFHFRAALRFSRAQTENSTPHGMIDLASCMTVKSAEYKAHKRNALEVSTPDTTFLMFADTEKEKDDW